MKILLATDGSPSAEAGLDCLMRFPFPKDSEITLLAVIDRDAFEKEDAGDLDDEQETSLKETEEAVEKEATELLAREAARLGAAGRSAATDLRIGHPAEEIVRAAEQLDSDCVIVGSHGMSGIKRFLLGSVSDHVLQYAPCSVLIVKRPDLSSEKSGEAQAPSVTDDQGQPLRILIGYDGSIPAGRAVEFLASLPIGERARVTVLTALPLITLYRQDIRQRLSWLWQQKKHQAQRALDEVKTKLEQVTPHVETRLRETPDVSDAILHEAAELGSDLIVLGHKGKGAIEKFLVGSVTTRIAHHAACSVLAVRGHN